MTVRYPWSVFGVIVRASVILRPASMTPLSRVHGVQGVRVIREKDKGQLQWSTGAVTRHNDPRRVEPLEECFEL
jgi:hypothetical protein